MSFSPLKNHAFIDGNKRVFFTVGVLFLELNGYEFTASEAEAAITFEALAAGDIGEEKLSKWFKSNVA